MYIHIKHLCHRLLHLPFMRELLGLIGGGLAGLVIYSVYREGATMVRAYLPAPEPAAASQEEIFKNIGERAQAVLKKVD